MIFCVVLHYLNYYFIASENDVEILLSSLKHEDLSWPEIENIWTKTTGYR